MKTLNDYASPTSIRRLGQSLAGGPISRAEVLMIASSLVEGVCATLDRTREAPCGECGVERYANWGDAQLFKQLDSTAAKLRRAALSLEKTGEGEEKEEA